MFTTLVTRAQSFVPSRQMITRSRRRRGVTLVEYALIAAVSLGIIIAVGALLSGGIHQLFSRIVENL